MNYNGSYGEDTLYRTMNEYRGKKEAGAALAAAAMLAFAGLALGVVFYRVGASDAGIDADADIVGCFRTMFDDLTGAGDRVSLVLSCFFREVFPLVLIFVGGYTVFAPILSAALCLWSSAVCGFAVCMLEATGVGGIFLESLIFLVCRIAIISICISASLRAYFFSKNFCKKGAELVDVFKKDESRVYFFDFVISSGSMFLCVSITLLLICLIR